MKRTVLTAVLLFSTALLFACGGYFSSSDNSNAYSANQAQANVEPPVDANFDANANANLANVNANVTNVVPTRRQPTPKPQPLTRIAPDDSVITAENNTQGDFVETRVFKNHDMVAKVERILPPSRTSSGSVRVFLKNGKVFEVPASRLKNALSGTPDDIIKAVGGDSATATSTPVNRPQNDPRGGTTTAAPPPVSTPPKR